MRREKALCITVSSARARPVPKALPRRRAQKLYQVLQRLPSNINCDLGNIPRIRLRHTSWRASGELSPGAAVFRGLYAPSSSFATLYTIAAKMQEISVLPPLESRLSNTKVHFAEVIDVSTSHARRHMCLPQTMRLVDEMQT